MDIHRGERWFKYVCFFLAGLLVGWLATSAVSYQEEQRQRVQEISESHRKLGELQQQLTQRIEPTSGSNVRLAEIVEMHGARWVKRPATELHGAPMTLKPPTAFDLRSVDSDDHRLLLLNFTPESHAVYQEMVIEQRRVDGKWIHDGVSGSKLHDGRRQETTKLKGENHGMERAWHANGQLQKEVAWINGKREGAGRGFDENGKLLWEATYKNDVEIDGKSLLNQAEKP